MQFCKLKLTKDLCISDRNKGFGPTFSCEEFIYSFGFVAIKTIQAYNIF